MSNASGDEVGVRQGAVRARPELRHPAPQDNERANLRFLDHWTPDFGIVIGATLAAALSSRFVLRFEGSARSLTVIAETLPSTSDSAPSPTTPR